MTRATGCKLCWPVLCYFLLAKRSIFQPSRNILFSLQGKVRKQWQRQKCFRCAGIYTSVAPIPYGLQDYWAVIGLSSFKFRRSLHKRWANKCWSSVEPPLPIDAQRQRRFCWALTISCRIVFTSICEDSAYYDCPWQKLSNVRNIFESSSLMRCWAQHGSEKSQLARNWVAPLATWLLNDFGLLAYGQPFFLNKRSTLKCFG